MPMFPQLVQAGTGPDPNTRPSPTLLTPKRSLYMLTGQGGGVLWGVESGPARVGHGG